jgi:dihydrofolate synthase / folylpolyglutamate synthase
MMEYIETLQWMYSRLPMFQRSGPAAYKPGLESTIALCTLLGNPQNNFKTIHIAGTNGKGSTSHMIASVLQEAGYKTGLYTSPHLKDFRERIKINGVEISEQAVSEFINLYKNEFEDLGLSFFEMTVGLAFKYFEDQKVDIAVIETGLGGRLDSTNIITPLLSVITNISKDHAALLGDTLQLIAFEKAGIIKKDIPVVIGETQPEIKDVFLSKATELSVPIFFADNEYRITSGRETPNGIELEVEGYNNFKTVLSPLMGDYQRKNIVTVLKAMEIINKTLPVSSENMLKGIKNVILNTGLTGRWQILSQTPKTICDTAHNEAGVKIVLNQLKKEKYNDLHIVWGMVNDKEISSVLKMLPPTATYYFCKPDIPRGLEAKDLAGQALKENLKGEIYSSVKQAVQAAKVSAKSNDLIFIGGSTFVVAEIV